MKQFVKSYAAFLFLEGLLLVLCMGTPAGMVLLVLLDKGPHLFWLAAALLPAIPALARTAWKNRREAGGGDQPRLKEAFQKGGTV